MADNRKFVQAQRFTLAGSGCSTTATSIIISDFSHIDAVGGGNIAMTDFGTLGFGTLEPGTAREELMSFTGVTQNGDGTATLTGVTRNLKTYSPYDQYSATGYAHSGGASFVISNNPGLYNSFANKENDESIAGIWTFDADNPPQGDATTAPTADAQYTNKKYVDDQNNLDVHLTGNQTIAGNKTFTGDTVFNEIAVYDAHPTFTSDTQIVDKKYVDDSTTAGAPDASTTVKGIVEEATQAEVDARTAVGGTSARLFVNPATQRGILYHDYAADAGANDSYTITVTPAPAAYTAGDVFTFKANTANTGAATLNVNSLGAKTIKKNVSADLDNGDIAAGQILSVCYDGTDFQLLASPFVPLRSSGVFEKNMADASTSQNIAHGLGKAPKRVSFYWAFSTGDEAMFGSGDFISPSSQSFVCNVFDISAGQSNSSYSSTETIVLAKGNLSNKQSGSVSVDATNITITWTKSSSPTGTAYLRWVAEA